MRRRRVKNSSLAPVISIALMLGIVAAISYVAILTDGFSIKKEYIPSENEATQSVVSALSDASSKPSSVALSKEPIGSVESKLPSNAPSKAPTDSGSSSIFAGVKWRSNEAETANVFKHGRELMLTNRWYELPDNFKWNLVLWNDGKTVDAMSLNYKNKDSIRAVDTAAYKPLKDLFAAAKKDGVPLELVSAFRSISLQDRLFDRKVTSYLNEGYSKSEAVKKANNSQAFTGTSEHNSGLGFDILEKGNWTLTESFDKTKQFEWLKENAEVYGFIMRYPADKTDKTGIMYEPWHFRYVGVDHAKRINELGYCLEEYIEYLDKQ